jgi:tetratricopeptide (TPR) repeat protein
MKKLACLVTALGLAAALAGCGPKPGPAAEALPEAEAPTVEERLEVARAYMEEGRVGDAARLYESVLEENSGSFEANLNLGLALMTMEDGRHKNERDYTEVRKHFRAARDIKADDPGPYLYLGTLDFREENYRQAIDNLDVAARLDPASEPAHEMLGMSLIEYGSAGRGKAELLRTLEINPGNANANLEVGKIHESGGEYESAREHLERALSANPNLDMAIYVLERVYYNLGLHDMAEETCKKFLEHYPKDIQSLETLGNIYRSQERTGEMIEVYEDLTKIRPKNTTYWSPLVQHYVDMENYAKAKKVLEAALKENPYYAYGNIHYGQVLLRYGDESYDDGDKMKALQYYGQAKLHFEKAKIDDRYVKSAFQLSDQANLRIDRASSR